MKKLNKKGLKQEGGMTQPTQTQQTQSLTSMVRSAIDDKGYDVEQVVDEMRFSNIDDETIMDTLLELGYSEEQVKKLLQIQQEQQKYMSDLTQLMSGQADEQEEAQLGKEMVDFFRKYNDTPFGYMYRGATDPISAISQMIGAGKKIGRGLNIGKKNKAYNKMMEEFYENPEEYVKNNSYIGFDPKTGFNTIFGDPTLFTPEQQKYFIEQGSKLDDNFSVYDKLRDPKYRILDNIDISKKSNTPLRIRQTGGPSYNINEIAKKIERIHL